MFSYGFIETCGSFLTRGIAVNLLRVSPFTLAISKCLFCNSFFCGLTLYWFLGNCQKFDGRSWRKVKPDEVQIITKIEGQVCNGSLFYPVCIILSQFSLTYISSLIGSIEFFVYFNFRCGWHFISSCYIQKRGGSTNLQTTERRRY